MTTNYARFLETVPRADGSSYVRLNDDCPQWLRDAVYEAHDEELPNDWRYETCQAIVSALDSADDDFNPMMLADELADVYTSDLLDWYRGNISRMGYADEMINDCPTSLDYASELLRWGQRFAIEQMVEVLASYLPGDES